MEQPAGDEILTPNAISRELTDFRGLCGNVGVSIQTGTCLAAALSEAEAFADGTQDIGVPDWDMLPQERGIAIAEDILVGWHVASSSNLLARHNVTALAEHLNDLARLPLNDVDRQQEFLDTAYELQCAGDFMSGGVRVSFIRRAQQSATTQKRVEFLIRHRWPAECKRPRVLGTISKNIALIREKLDERSAPGVACICLENVLNTGSSYTTAEDKQDYLQQLERRYRPLERAILDPIVAEMQDSTIVGCLLHHSELIRYSGNDTVGRIVVRTLVTRSGSVVRTDTIPQVIAILQAESGG